MGVFDWIFGESYDDKEKKIYHCDRCQKNTEHVCVQTCSEGHFTKWRCIKCGTEFYINNNIFG